MHYLISLGFTLLLEELAALAWGLRGRDLALVALVNVLTNPLVVLAHGLLLGHSVLLHTVLPELLAVAAEALCYCRLENRVRAPVRFSVAANVFSYGVGLALQLIR